MTTRRPLMMRVGSIGLAVIVGLALAEIGARVMGPASYGPRRTHYEVLPFGSELPGWTFLPGSAARFTWDGDPYGVLPAGAEQEIPINALGLRGPHPVGDRPTLLLLGDSFTFGEGVVDEDTFSARIAKDLPSHQVVNAGVSGQGTVHQRFRLDHHLAQLQPRAVVLVYVPNDAIPLARTNTSHGDLVKAFEESRSRLWAVVGGALARGGTEDWYRSHYFGENAQNWRDVQLALAEMRDVTQRNGIAFGVALFPLLHRLDANPLGDLHDEVARACGELGIPFVDLTPALAEHADEQLWAHPTDHHPNGRAHGIVAPVLADFAQTRLGVE